MNPIYRKDYARPDFAIDEVALTFELEPEATRVINVMRLQRQNKNVPLVLNGEKIQLLSLRLDSQLLTESEYSVTETLLTIPNVPDIFTLEVETRCNPKANLALDGLYQSSGNFCTQCESHGFRKITYYLDRPDVMAKFTTTIIADAEKYPMLLSNGNCLSEEILPNGKKKAVWQDPFKKPCYLFALVAGTLDCHEDSFITMSGRKIKLQIFVEPGNVPKTYHAMAMLKEAMRWDEEKYGREYDLDIFMIVAVSDFNMGAMENKGLNIFNAKYILADDNTATDTDYENIGAVVAHEYFHNWTGNRITCRDWFQLSLKEGLTVFRDQEFTADTTTRTVARIDDVRTIKLSQFAEDAGPLAHPVRPDSYIEMNNFYTVTVYHKGAEVVRMLETLEGQEGFRKGMDLYFERFDGMAVTCDDFVQAHADANVRDYQQFLRWYSQAGTPHLKFSDQYDTANKKYFLTVEQKTLPTADGSSKEAFHIPIRFGLYDQHGKAIQEGTLELTAAQTTFEFNNVADKPIPSLMRNFSAPVKWEYPYQLQDWIFLLKNDADLFNRYEMHQQIFYHYFNSQAVLDKTYLGALLSILESKDMDHAIQARLLSFPSYQALAEIQPVIRVEHTMQQRERMITEIANYLAPAAYKRLINEYSHDETKCNPRYTFEQKAVARRAIQQTLLRILFEAHHKEALTLAENFYASANNMTDRFNAIQLIAMFGDVALREKTFKDFYHRYENDSLVMEKWFALQASVPHIDTIYALKDLMRLPVFDFKNPNKVRSLLGTFSQQNFKGFHLSDGTAYEFLAEQVLALDKLNPITAARLLEPLTRWKRYEDAHAVLIRSALQKISLEKLSNDLSELVNKSL